MAINKICILLFTMLLVYAAQAQTTRNSIKIGFRNEIWESEYPDRQLYNLTYGVKLGEHELFVRSNLMAVNKTTGLQVLADFYPKFNKKSYGYFSAAYADFSLFPRVRLAAEYFRIFGEWETSLGLRYSRTIDKDIYGFTGMVGKYHGNWFTYLRPVFSIVDGEFAEGFMLSTRRYFANKYQFAEALIYYGNDTGEIADLSTLNLGLKYFLIRLAYQQPIKQNWLINAGVDYSGYYNLGLDRYIKVVSFDFSISKSF